jgi:hypothetical protein
VRRYQQDEWALADKWKTSGIGAGWEVVKATGGALNPVLGGALSVLEEGYDAIKDLRHVKSGCPRGEQESGALIYPAHASQEQPVIDRGSEKSCSRLPGAYCPNPPRVRKKSTKPGAFTWSRFRR